MSELLWLALAFGFGALVLPVLISIVDLYKRYCHWVWDQLGL